MANETIRQDYEKLADELSGTAFSYGELAIADLADREEWIKRDPSAVQMVPEAINAISSIDRARREALELAAKLKTYADAIRHLRDHGEMPPTAPTPGHIAGWMVKQAGFELGATGKALQQTMDDWGWSGCIAHRQEIVDWFAGEAAKHDLRVLSDEAFGLMKAGIAAIAKGQGL